MNGRSCTIDLDRVSFITYFDDGFDARSVAAELLIDGTWVEIMLTHTALERLLDAFYPDDEADYCEPANAEAS
jgi:hypothetical protein